MLIFFGSLSILVAAFLVFLVLIQNHKGGGLSGALGSGNLTQVIGASRSKEQIHKITWWALGVLLVLTVLSGIGAGAGQDKSSAFEQLMNSERVDMTPTQAPNLNNIPQQQQNTTPPPTSDQPAPNGQK